MLDQYRSMIGGMLPEAGNGAGGDRLMLQSKVEPFTRDSNPTSINDDSDLWKVFDDDVSLQRIRTCNRTRTGIAVGVILLALVIVRSVSHTFCRPL